MEPNQFFTIQNYPDDIYNAVGRITKSAQEWEDRFKKLISELHIVADKKIEKLSLNKLNETLKKNQFINQREYENIRKVIEIRNYINHTFFLKDFNNTYNSCEEKIAMLSKNLKNAQFLIFEATDIIDNMIDKLQGKSIMRPTVFD